MIYGYARVSTKEQNLERQLQALKPLCDEIYQDKESGKNTDRDGLQELLSKLKTDDVVIIHSLDRLSRDYADTSKLWREITEVKKAHIKVLDMDILDTTKTNTVLEGKLISDIVLKLLSYVAQKEREKIKERQKQGIAIARANGKYANVGRKAKLNKEVFIVFDNKVKNEKGYTVAKACNELKITPTSFYRFRAKWCNNTENAS